MQFVALLVLQLTGEESMSRISEALSVDQTSLTRMMMPLKRSKLVKAKAGKDRRTQLLSLTPKGRETLKAAIPHWRSAQLRVLEVFGAPNWDKMLKELERAEKLKPRSRN